MLQEQAVGAFHLRVVAPREMFCHNRSISLVIPVASKVLNVVTGHRPIATSLAENRTCCAGPSNRGVLFSLSKKVLSIRGGVIGILYRCTLLPRRVSRRLRHERVRGTHSRLEGRRDGHSCTVSGLVLSGTVGGLGIGRGEDVGVWSSFRVFP